MADGLFQALSVVAASGNRCSRMRTEGGWGLSAGVQSEFVEGKYGFRGCFFGISVVYC